MDTDGYLRAIIDYGQVVIVWLAVLLLFIATVYGIRFISIRRYLKLRPTTWLEITPPIRIEKTPEATEHLFAVIHGYRTTRSLSERILGREPVMSFEIVSTKRGGIRYLVQVDASRSSSLQKTIIAYIPDSKVREVAAPSRTTVSVAEFKQSRHYVLPIKTMTSVERHDPMSYLTGAMTKLEDGDQVILQMVIRPLFLPEARRLSARILTNEDILRAQSNRPSLLRGIFEGASSIATELMNLIGESYSGAAYGHRSTRGPDKDARLKTEILKGQRPARTVSSFEQELMASMHEKLNKPLFAVNLRLMVSGSSAKRHIFSLRSALDAYAVPPYQGLTPVRRLLGNNRYRIARAEDRLPSLTRRSSLILSSQEVASLFHFPSSRFSKTDNLVASLSKTLPAPISLKQDIEFDVILGENIHNGTKTLIGLTEQERERHLYVIGGTGNGKTTLLQYGIIQDIRNGKGVAIVDPHGDMAEMILRHIPPDRLKDVVYFNPDDLEYPIGLNLLELTSDLSGNELLREKDIITESVVSVFRKIFSDEDNGGHRIEYVLRNAIQTALTVEDATLFTVYDLLNDRKYQKEIVEQLEDQNLINFWNSELKKAGDMQKVKMASGITAKIGRFLFSASARQILEQPKSTIDFDDIINSGKIFICNFSKGLIGEDTSELFGITVLAKLQLASLRRARVRQDERRPFYIYVDEFQNFATTSFVQMLSESRKYRVYLTMAEQSTSQQKEQQMVNIILANVGTVICFRTGNPHDEQLLLPLFAPYVEKGEITNLPAYNFYAKLSAIRPQEPLSGQTLLLENSGQESIAQQAIELSRKTFATKKLPPDADTVAHPIDKRIVVVKKQVKKETEEKINEAIDKDVQPEANN